MTIHSRRDTATYLCELRQAFGSSTDFGVERFTGLVLGKFFCVTHHCSYEWESKYTCQKNTTVGIVGDTADGCVVHYLTTTGELRPQMIIPLYLLSILISLVFAGSMKIATHIIGIFTLAAILSAIIEPMTSASKDGGKSLIALLKDPQKPYDNL